MKAVDHHVDVVESRVRTPTSFVMCVGITGDIAAGAFAPGVVGFMGGTKT